MGASAIEEVEVNTVEQGGIMAVEKVSSLRFSATLPGCVFRLGVNGACNGFTVDSSPLVLQSQQSHQYLHCERSRRLPVRCMARFVCENLKIVTSWSYGLS